MAPLHEFSATPLFWAVQWIWTQRSRDEKCIKLVQRCVLLEAGANARTLNKQGLSALEMGQFLQEQRYVRDAKGIRPITSRFTSSVIQIDPIA